MKLYIAGIFSSNFSVGERGYLLLTEEERRMRDKVEWMLESYHYIHSQRYVDKIRAKGNRVFLDSGAFSAMTKGVTIDLRKYVNYIKANIDIIEHVDGQPVASVLDGIGDPYKTYCNQLEMEHLGVRPLPCFHYGEDERYLEWYVQNYSYITLGGMVPISTPQLKIWLDRIWGKYLTFPDGRPRIKVHGFGLTTPSLMARYPWYSVDSSSWIRLGWAGSIIMRNGKMLPISSQNPARKILGQHYANLSPAIQKAASEELGRYGLTVERAATVPYSRWAFNAGMFCYIGEDCSQEDPKFIPDQEGLF